MFGHSISIERLDRLDQMALHWLKGQKDSSVMDLCCGEGGLTKNLAEVCDLVVGVDINPPDFVLSNVHIVAIDIRDLNLPKEIKFSAITWQRAIHYLSYKEAENILKKALDWICPNGKLFISASGINSELGNDYPGKEQPVQNRMDFLSENMQNKHDIQVKVCLYTMPEFLNLLMDTGWEPTEYFVSEFGNLKCVATLKKLSTFMTTITNSAQTKSCHCESRYNLITFKIEISLIVAWFWR